MKLRRLLRTLVILAILSSNVGCDQISKNIVRQRVDYREQISVINNYLTLTRIENTGAFLGAGQSLPQPTKFLLLSLLPLIALGLAIAYLLKTTSLHRTRTIGFSFIVGGGIGNIYDRLVYGSVTDFLHIDLVLFQTGIFNMADVSVVTGASIILFESFFNRANLNCKSY